MSERVILYTRVSTDEQAERGNSLTNQLTVLTQYCKVKGYTILNHFVDDYSAKTFDRPAWKKLMAYAIANKREVDSVLVIRWDRFSRNLDNAKAAIKTLQKIGIEVNSMEQPLDMSVPESVLLLNIYLTIPEIENTKNSIRTTESSRAARLSGCWTGSAPRGYNNFRDHNGKSTLVFNDKAECVLEAFIEVAKNLRSVDSIRKDMWVKGFKMAKQSFLNMLRNKVYIGQIIIKPFKKEPASIVKGLHDPIVDESLFRTVQNALAGKKNTHQKSHKEDDAFPLRGFLLCPVCSKPLTGGHSKGRNKYYPYYKCQNNCIDSIKADEANSDFESFLRTIKISPEVSDLYQLAMEDVFKKHDGDKKVKLAKLITKKEELENGLEKATTMYFVNGSISDITYNMAISQLTKQKVELMNEISEVATEEDNFSKYSKFAVPFLSAIDVHYKKAPLATKKFIIGSIFPEKLVYSGKQYRTTKFNEVLALITNPDGISQTIGNKKATKNRGLSTEAPPAGLEPATL